MVKAVISMLVVLSILIAGAVFEQHHINKDFKVFHEMVFNLQEKISDETCKEGDIESIQNWWHKKTCILYMYVPHNDIKDIEVYLVKVRSLIGTGNFDLAKMNADILINMCLVIPDIYSIKIHNIF